MTFDPERIICSSITLRHLPLAEALAEISARGFTGIDLGALPGVCNHVPEVLSPAGVAEVAETVRASGLAVRSINADIGALNAPGDAAAERSMAAHLDLLIDLAVRLGARAIVLPNGAIDHAPRRSTAEDLDLVAARLASASSAARARGIELWVEAPHFHRFAYNLERSAALIERLAPEIGVVCDISHIVASGATPREFVELAGARIAHVHLRDAEPGYIHHSIGRGRADFADALAALGEIGYAGQYALELETRDVSDAERPAAALAAAEYIDRLLPIPA